MVLRVRLKCKEELPHAMAAIRFMYTGEVEAAGFEGLLRTRRLAARLWVEGCVKACDSALLALLGATPPPGGDPFGAVMQLYAHRDLVPGADAEPDGKPSVAALSSAVLGFCRDRLAQHFPPDQADGGSGAQGGGSAAAIAATPASLRPVMVWVFPSAPAVLNNADALKALLRLPARAMAELLSCEAFATDSEDSVLLLLAHWLEANPQAPDPDRRRLVRAVRLVQLSGAFRCALLPELPWLGLGTDEHRFLCAFAAVPPARRSRLAVNFQYDMLGPWYSSAPRPSARSPKGRRLQWSIGREELAASCNVYGVFAAAGPGSGGLVVAGVEWRPRLSYLTCPGYAAAGFFCDLHGRLPAVFGGGSAEQQQRLSWLHCAAAPGPCSLTLRRAPGPGGQEQEALEQSVGEDAVPTIFASFAPPGEEAEEAVNAEEAAVEGEEARAATVSSAQGPVAAPPLVPLSRWRGYLRDGRITGTLALL
ncbi:hypothetical protein GPECTOR_11g61 [Gonium pectorale]|uniref:BACK domain-containing protein n=1 Tax=Gonium pectorale TaxID=33097 RepID=A0A150GPZ2_GONPE|nr:hypothetical protein GPECTOR_11g61 [Gonium pectorale]|eukprot:KXZ51936.1 hypothetical protein GPECTOR_11g61 [Gonium pectorale]